MRKSLLVAVFVLVGWISAPAHAAFCPGVTPWVFDDVDSLDPFCGFITDVANRGVTLGCTIIDPNHRLYCPADSVTRKQMAAFMSRLASNLLPNGNIVLAESTAFVGNIMKGSIPFIHNFGSENTFVGEGSGNFTMLGNGNSAVGVDTLVANDKGIFNTALGAYALNKNTDGAENTASGHHALFSNTTGDSNTATGASALYSSMTGDSNTASGYVALYSNVSGSNNTADGFGALAVSIDGTFNTAVGTSALNQFGTGNYNIAIGANAGGNSLSGDHNIYIGSPGGIDPNESHAIRIGDANQTRTFVAGIHGVTTGSATGIPVLIDVNGQLGTISSSRQVKDDIADMGDASSPLMRLRPVTFHYKAHANNAMPALQYGLVAEEVAEVAPDLVARRADGQVETVYYQFLAPMLLNEVQKQRREIAALRAQVAGLQAAQQGEMAELRARVETLLATRNGPEVALVRR